MRLAAAARLAAGWFRTRATNHSLVIPVARLGARTGIHNPRPRDHGTAGGYGFRARGFDPRPGMTRECRRRLPLRHRRREIRTRRRDHPLAELLAQHAGLDLLDRALGEIAELERAERHPDQPAHRQSQVTEHVLYLAVLALADGE